MKKLLMTLAAGLCAVTAQADLGWSYAQCEQAWGKPHGPNLHVRFLVQWFVYHGRNQKRPRNHAVKFTVPIYKKPNF